MNLVTIAWKSIRQRWLASALTALSIALGVALMVAVLVINGVEQQRIIGETSEEQLIRLCDRVPRQAETRDSAPDRPSEAPRKTLPSAEIAARQPSRKGRTRAVRIVGGSKRTLQPTGSARG